MRFRDLESAAVGARSVVRMLQFNGKQEDADATRADNSRAANAAAPNLRCPRNGKRTNCAVQHWRKPVIAHTSRFHHKPLSALNKRMGRR